MHHSIALRKPNWCGGIIARMGFILRSSNFSNNLEMDKSKLIGLDETMSVKRFPGFGMKIILNSFGQYLSLNIALKV